MAMKFTDPEVSELIASGQPVVIDFWATWCSPCVGMGPVIDALAEEYEGRVAVGKYNIEEENDLSVKYRIMSIPAILFFKNGEMVKRLAGSQKIETLRENVEQLLAD